jgi:phage-related protein
MEIEFGEDSNGTKPVSDFIKKSNRRESILKKLELYEKQALVNLLKSGVAEEFKWVKSKNGFSLYEFKPGPNRFLFVALDSWEKIFLVHAFIKKTNKTPQKEINKALYIAFLLSKKYKLR